MTDREQRIVAAVMAELERAERKFPGWPADAIHAAAVVGEEAGELTRAALQFTYEGGSADGMIKEAIQTAAMAVRFLLNAEELRGMRCRQVARHGMPEAPR